MVSGAIAGQCGKRAAAVALKMRCHHTVNAMGPQTPPEVFVYRGNAYQALDQPYFALADYTIANRIVKLSGKHQEACATAIQSGPRRQVGTYPGVDQHLNLLAKPFLVDSEIRLVNAFVGRGVFALRDFLPGETVMTPSQPWLQYPLQEGLCSNCSKRLGTRVFPCDNEKCHEEYCSRECRQDAMSTYHGRVCNNGGFQGVELDIFTRMHDAATSATERNILAGYLLTMRIVAAAMLQRAIPSHIPEVRTMTGRLVFDPQELAGPLLDLYDKLSRFCGFTTSISFEEFVGVYSRVRANAFGTEYNLEWHIPKAIFNSSCDPNAVFDVREKTMKTISPIRAGEEVTISYYPHLNALPSEARRIELDKRDFLCTCRKCAAGY